VIGHFERAFAHVGHVAIGAGHAGLAI